MIVLDTSVWIQYFRGKQSSLVAQVNYLLDEDLAYLALPVKIEILGGARKSELYSLQRTLSALPQLKPTDNTWKLVEDWTVRAVNHNERFGFADLLIAALTTESKARLWSLDTDFERMAKVGFVKLHDATS